MWSRYVASQVKQNGCFCLGVAAGLYLSLVWGPRPETVCDARDYLPPETDAGVDQPSPAPDFQDHHDQAAPTRPRYYTAELGIRSPVLCAVMTSVRELQGGRAAAINATVRPALPDLRFFVSASDGSPPPAPDVVLFTDARRTLAPFHALKYLADNYLDDYDHFLLAEDTLYIDARALTRAARLRGHLDTYGGRPDPADPALCDLRAGVLLSNSVLRSVRGQLDWCVRNAYSSHHHENVGRCVRRAADLLCQELELGSEPAGDAAAVHRAHVESARRTLTEVRARLQEVREELAALRGHHPEGFRNETWPAGLRADAGMSPPPPLDRHDHLRWTWFNESVVLLPDDHTDAMPLVGAWRDSVRDVLHKARALPGLQGATLLAGLWRWDPARALQFRLTLRDASGRARVVEAARVLGAAKLLAEPYVTETAPLTVLLADTLSDAYDAADLRRALAAHVAADPRRTTDLIMVLSCVNATLLAETRAEVSSLRHSVRVEARGCGDRAWPELWARARDALPARDRLVLVVHAGVTYTEDLLNRARMNTIRGRQWFRPMPLQLALVSRAGRTDARFSRRHARVWCAHYSDLPAPPARLPALSRVLHAPDPALVLHVPRACRAGRGPECGRQGVYMGERGAVGALVLRERPDIR